MSMVHLERTIQQCLNEVGVMGRYQLYLAVLYVLSAPLSGILTFQFQSLSVVPEIHCLSKVCEEQSPKDICDMKYRQDWLFSAEHNNYLTQFSLFCDRKYLVSAGTSIYFIGFFVAVAPLSSLTDYIGRRKASIIFLLLHIAAIFLNMISTSLTEIMVCRFLLGAAHGGISVSFIVAFYEFTSASWATFFMMVSSAAFSMGGGLSGLIAMWSKEWQTTCYIPVLGYTVIVLLFYCTVPETPHWLFAKGYEAAAIESLNKIAVYNGKEPFRNIELVSVTGEATSSKKSQSFRIIWDAVFLRKAIMCLAVAWFTVSLTYYGLEFNAGTLGNEYVVMMLMGCFDAPFKFAMFFIAGKWGRQFSCQLYLVSALFCLIASGVPFVELIQIYGNFTLKTIFVACGRAFGGSVFAMLYIYTTEVLPTLVRSLGISCCSTVARIGSLLAPLVILINEISPYIIYICIVVFIVISMSLLRNIPETLGRPLPNNLEDCRQLFENNRKVNKVDDGLKSKANYIL